MQKTIKNILIINPFGIGDVLFSTPLIESISSQIGGCGIGFLCNRRTEDILRNNPHVNWIFVLEKDEFRQLWKRSPIDCIKKSFSLLRDMRSKRFDIAIDLSLNREFGFLALLAGIPRRIGFNYGNRGIFLTEKIGITGYRNKHIVEYYLDLLNFINLKPACGRLALYTAESDKKWAQDFMAANGIKEGDLVVGIAPAGGASWGKDAEIKHWKAQKFAEVADLLAEKLKAKIIILGSATETGICETVKNNMVKPAVNACGKTTLLQFAALTGNCSLVIANDGGPLHIAVAMGARTVGIFGPVDERVYGQFPAGNKHKIVKSGIECRPCYRNFKLKDCDIRRCLDGISPQDVFKAAEEALKV